MPESAEPEQTAKEFNDKNAHQRWTSLVMNLAFLVSKCKKLDTMSRELAVDWLTEMIE